MKKPSLPGVPALLCAAAFVLLVPAGCTGDGSGDKPASGPAVGETDRERAADAGRQGGWYTRKSLDGDTVAIVDGMKITVEEFDAALASVAFQAKQATPEGRMDVLMGRIDSLLVKQAAVEAGYLDRPGVARAIERIRRRYTVWPARRKILAPVTVSEEELDAAFTPPGDILDLTVLLVDDLEAAEAALRRVADGEELETVAKEVSTSPGALASNVQRKGLTRGSGMYPPDVEDAVFALAAGEISEPLATPVGYLVARLDQRRRLEAAQVAVMREGERERLLGRKKNKVLAEALAGLRAEAEVTILRERYGGDDLPASDALPFDVWHRLGEIEVARVDGTLLTMADVFRNLGDYEGFQDNRPETLDASYRNLLDQQIDEVLLYNLGKKDNLHLDPGIEQAVASFVVAVLVGEYSSDIAFRIGQNDLDMDRCRTFFDERRASYLDDERLSLSSILVRRETDATMIMDRLKGGADFAALAREYSVDDYASAGGDMGTLREEELAPIFGAQGAEELIRRGRQGGGELLLRTTSGYHIVRIGTLYEIGVGSLDEEGVLSRVLPDYLAFCRDEAVFDERSRLRSKAEIVIDVGKIENYQPPPGPPPGFHGGSISMPEGGSTPHGGGGRPPGHP